MEIAPGVSATRWPEIEHHFKDPDSPYWAEAIDILKKRIEGRYLNPVQILLDDDEPKPYSERRHGFVIIAIDCLLIETFQSFIEGEPNPRHKSKRMFRTFLTNRASFAPHFSEDTAEAFCDDFRNGIFHQAEIKRDSKVWSIGPLVEVKANGMVINRTAFHKALMTEFNAYLTDLGNPANVELRNKFKTKMNFIARMPP